MHDNLGESANTIKNHVKKSLSQEYLFTLLNADDYFSKENSIKALMKVQIMFKARILKLIARVYLQDGSDLILR